MNNNKLSPNTMTFRKRFNMMAAPMKFETAQWIGDCVERKRMPTNRPMTDEELQLMQELAEWCNDNILFDRKPAGGYSEYQ